MFGMKMVGINMVRSMSVVVMIGFVICFIVLVVVFFGLRFLFVMICLIFFIMIIVLFIMMLMVSMSVNSEIVFKDMFKVKRMLNVLISEIGIVMVGMIVVC